MVKAYRVYYTTFDEETHRKIIEELEQELGLEPIEHKSFINEFRFLEFRFGKKDEIQLGLEDKIKKIVKKILGEDSYVRVDYISV